MEFLSSFFGRAVGAVTGNFRLIIEYILIGMIVVMAGVLFTLWFQKTDIQLSLEKAKNSLLGVQQRLDVVESANAQNTQTIDQLKQLRARDNKALQALVQNFQQLSDRNLAVKNKLRELEAKNEVVRRYLNQSVPPELRRMLDESDRAHSTGDQAVGSQAPSQPAPGVQTGH